MKHSVALAILFVALLSLIATAHPGRTDSKGGHNDSKNGGYHYHNSGVSSGSSSGSSTRSASSSSTYTPRTTATTNSPASEPPKLQEDLVRRVGNFDECTTELTRLNLKINKLTEQLDEQRVIIIRMKAALKKNGITIDD